MTGMEHWLFRRDLVRSIHVLMGACVLATAVVLAVGASAAHRGGYLFRAGTGPLPGGRRMKIATLPPPAAPILEPIQARARIADYVELIRPRMTVLVLFTVGAGAFLAAQATAESLEKMLPLLLHAVLGTGLVAAAASAINQYLERHSDALMRRTADRPLPAGRLQPGVVLGLGVGLALAGFLYLLVTLAQPVAAIVAAATFASYVFLYTPLKRRTPLNTLVGAVPGALPPVIGWAAVRGTINAQAVSLFLLVFVWQVPHFLAIAWIYRDQYAAAGLQMLPVMDEDGVQTSRQMVRYCLVLVPVSLLPAVLGMAGPLYIVGAVVLGLGFLSRALGFSRASSIGEAAARATGVASLFARGLCCFCSWMERLERCRVRYADQIG